MKLRIPWVGWLVLAMTLQSFCFDIPLAAQVKHQFKCRHGVIDGRLGKCRQCSDAEESQDCAEAKQVLREKSSWTSKDIAEMPCHRAITFAGAWGFKTLRERREEADRRAASQIDSEVESYRNNSPLRQFNSQSWDRQRETLLQSDPDSFSDQADSLEKRARDLDEQARQALLSGNYAQSRALSSAAAELRQQAGQSRSLDSRARTEQQTAKRQDDFSNSRTLEAEIERMRKLRSEIEADPQRHAANSTPEYWKQQVGGLKTQVSELEEKAREARSNGDYLTANSWDAAASETRRHIHTVEHMADLAEDIGRDVKNTLANTLGNLGRGRSDAMGGAFLDEIRNRYEDETGFRTTLPGQAIPERVKEYIEDANDRVEPLLPLAGKAQDYVYQIGDKALQLLSGDPSGAFPSSSGSTPAYRPPPAWLATPHQDVSPTGNDSVTDQFGPVSGSRFDTPSAGSRFDSPPPAPLGSRFDQAPSQSPPAPESKSPNWIERLGHWWNGAESKQQPKRATHAAPAAVKDQFSPKGSRFD
ncbi:MAG: hypothetical protein KIT22_02785 [Verrucomicrobiae bacterium]|nr:hypothetical protein [Verrucomicrobiae bacterium]